MNESSPELETHERAALLEAVSGPMPDDFARRVVDAWTTECSRPRARPVQSLHRAISIGAAALAAALLLAWWGSTAVAERLEQREREVRLAAAPADPPFELAHLRSKTGALLAEHCSPCHDSELGGSKPDALAVFDTSAHRWWVTMSDRQLSVMLGRIRNEDAMTVNQQKTVKRFVDAEIAYRQGGV